MRLSLCPVSFEEASLFVQLHHRHRLPPRGHKFSLGASDGSRIVGVAIVGRPVSRVRDDGMTLEVTRLCVVPGLPPVIDRRGKAHAPAACSFLWAAARRAALALGYERIGTYNLWTETGISLNAAGWRLLGETRGRSWSTPSRPRIDHEEPTDKRLFGSTHARKPLQSTTLERAP